MTELIESVQELAPATPVVTHVYMPTIETLDVIRKAQRQESVRQHREHRLIVRKFYNTMKPLMDHFVDTVMPESVMLISVKKVYTKQDAFDQIEQVRTFASNLRNKSADKPDIVSHCDDFIQKLKVVETNLYKSF